MSIDCNSQEQHKNYFHSRIYIKFKMRKWIFLLGLIILINSQLKSQVRVLFYQSNLENACSEFSEKQDLINIRINFNGTVLKEIKNVNGKTYCKEYEVLPERIIYPADNWYHIDDWGNIWIFFDQETIFEVYGSRIWKIKARSTIVNPVIYDGVSYDCVLYGDGTEQHFGTDRIPPAAVYLECNPLLPVSNVKK